LKAKEKEMKRKLREELVKLSTAIIASQGKEGIPEMYEVARSLYEKLAVLKFIEEELQDVEIDVSKNIIAAKFEKMANAVMNENKSVPESNPHEEDIITPGIDTIKHMISEMPGSVNVDQFFADFVAKSETVKSDKEWVTPGAARDSGNEVKKKSLNDLHTKKEIAVGINDRHAFVKQLFDGSTEDFNRVISQLNTIETEERSVAFIENMVKPDYDNWKEKEEIASRFMNLIRRRFN
jgi:hypothetical protein